MKKIFRIFLSLTVAFIFLNMSVLANENVLVNNNNQNDNLKITNGDKSIEYNEELGGFVLKNITVDDVLDAFDSSNEFDRKGSLKSSDDADPQIVRKLNLQSSRAGTYYADYVVAVNVKGIRNENVKVSYTCNMVMTTLTFNGRNYAQFVKFNLIPKPWLNSNSYQFGNGTGDPKCTIKNGGATINIMQTIQLETTSAVSTDVGLSAGWINLGSSTSKTNYFRSPAKTYTAYTNLPLINVMQ